MIESTFDYQAFWIGIIVGVMGVIIFIRMIYQVDEWVTRHIDRKIQKQNQERYERMKQMIMDDTIKQLEDHANGEDE